MTGMFFSRQKQAAVYTEDHASSFTHLRQVFTAEAQRNAENGEREKCSSVVSRPRETLNYLSDSSS